ncbi:MAG: hypothetical protein H0W70_10565 [Actinobacteria bacterium]|nr:hypothetical protein [Actinomycetota bacterium]
MSVSREQEVAALAEAKGAVPRAATRATYHLRRYMPLYVFGTVWALMIGLFPTINHDGNSTQLAGDATGQSGNVAPGQSESGPTAADGSVNFDTGATLPSGASRSTGSSNSRVGGAISPPPAVGSGVTVGGVACKPGVRQIPFSQYAPPCVAKFTGNNGGVTSRGVTDKTIKITIKRNSDASGPNAQAVDQVNKSAGNATVQEGNDYGMEYVQWFNKMFELYGRRVELNIFDGQGNGTEEAQSKGQQAACADATNIALTQKSFGAVAWGFGYMSQPFSECAAQQKLYVSLGAPYFPERDFKKWNPYVWAGVMECERISHDVAEYIGKRLAHKNAKWAGDLALQNAQRRFATYVPDNDGYQHCTDLTQEDLKTKYNTTVEPRYSYALDVSQFPSEAARGIVQFQAAKVSTVVMACDPLSSVFLTQAANKQRYRPEWLSIGVAAQDTNGFARLWDQEEVDGHLFGMSQIGTDSKVYSQTGEAALAYKAATGKSTFPTGAALTYYFLLQLFNQLQAAGPNLTPQNIAIGTHNLPAGGGDTAAVGTWSFKDDHTAIDDSREIYYEGNATGFDGKKGAYLETYGGRRFSAGNWPAEDPPIYPGK